MAQDGAGFGERARAEIFRASGAKEEVPVTLAAEELRERARRIAIRTLERVIGGRDA